MNTFCPPLYFFYGMFYDTALDCHVVSCEDTGLATSVSCRLTIELHPVSLYPLCHRPACEDSKCLQNSSCNVEKWFADVGAGTAFCETSGVRYTCTNTEELPSATSPTIPVFFTLMEELSSSVVVLHRFTLQTLAHQCSVSASHGFSPSG